MPKTKKTKAVGTKFFREGKSGQWKNILTVNQIKLIEKELYKPMSKLGYI